MSTKIVGKPDPLVRPSGATVETIHRHETEQIVRFSPAVLRKLLDLPDDAQILVQTCDNNEEPGLVWVEVVGELKGHSVTRKTEWI